MSKRRFYAAFCILLFLTGLFMEKRLYQRAGEAASTAASVSVTEERIAYLTFDDGPSEVTREILKVLREENAKATFFLIGEQITEEKKELLSEMVKEGHELGIHTYSHKPDEIYQSADAFIEDVLKTAEKIEEAVGVKPRYVRFPWGSNNRYVKGMKAELVERLEQAGYTYFDWNVSGEDSIGTPDTATIYENVKKDALKYNQPVILLHDSATNQNTAKVLPEILKLYREAGYSFETVDKRERAYQYQ
jgi:peptidoglycan/xylan/chitin deacetylase (PgdA/CDA1 family)